MKHYKNFDEILGLYVHHYHHKPEAENAYRVTNTGVFYDFSKYNPSVSLSTYSQKNMLDYINEGSWKVFKNQEKIHQQILELDPNYKKEFLIYESL
jgi:hypothetical protein